MNNLLRSVTICAVLVMSTQAHAGDARQPHQERQSIVPPVPSLLERMTGTLGKYDQRTRDEKLMDGPDYEDLYGKTERGEALRRAKRRAAGGVW